MATRGFKGTEECDHDLGVLSMNWVSVSKEERQNGRWLGNREPDDITRTRLANLDYFVSHLSHSTRRYTRR